MVDIADADRKMALHRSIAGKPNERCPSPIIPAVANFALAKRMHADNLDHQPLPDCVTDLAYRKQQITGDYPGLKLDIEPFATGVGVKAYNVGPTHCTKMKVFRPKTTAISSNSFKIDNERLISSAKLTKQVGAMDLAIGWDTKPPFFSEEPLPSKHLDGSNDSAGPAVFSFVKSPRNDATTQNTGHAACVFNNTLGESGFFERDIMQRKTDFSGRHINQEKLCGCDTGTNDLNNETFTVPRARSVTRDFVRENSMMPNRSRKESQSIANLTTRDLKALREKYLGADDTHKINASTIYQPEVRIRENMPSFQLTRDDMDMHTYQPKPRGGPACRRSNPTFFQRARSRLCHKIAPEPNNCFRGADFDRHITSAKIPPFRSGIPRYNATGQYINSGKCCSYVGNHPARVLVVPRPRNPYLKKNYDIDTLIPPFRSMGGGASEGGYPEHWRLSSVYQHAYKPLEQRRRPLLDTVYK